ncbi:MBL fold metallo-hydrolase [Halomarina litorea]|uniref:MBL fold metallo-hydrolase n=1 Tax=Halomarina litorea TaxID=2961595 RepID=UPI0020C3C319|nr:MBL fold metallo-hydrolase [Halomarina sp. BCD28]
MVSITLVRHATLLLDFDGTRLLVDPMLAERGAMPPIPNSPNDRRNPLVALPDVSLEADGMLVTHLHRDHLDDAAREQLPADIPVLCQPEDESELEETFEDVRPVTDSLAFEGIDVDRVPARHGHGELAEQMAPVSGFVLDDGSTTLYHAGDTVWYDAVGETLSAYDPDAVVVNAGAAQFTEGRPITMTAEDVISVCEHTDAPVLADHVDAINHCLQTRGDLAQALAEGSHAEQVVVPEDGETVDLGRP